MTDTSYRHVGPIDFRGPAVDREAKIKEDNNHPPVDVAQWYANSVAQQAEMEAGEAAAFKAIDSAN